MRPLRIVVIGSAAGERVGCHWRPSGIEQIRAGFHHNHRIASATPFGDRASPSLIPLFNVVLDYMKSAVATAIKGLPSFLARFW